MSNLAVSSGRRPLETTQTLFFFLNFSCGAVERAPVKDHSDCNFSHLNSGLPFKPFISHNLIVKITVYMHTINKFKQLFKCFSFLKPENRHRAILTVCNSLGLVIEAEAGLFAKLTICQRIIHPQTIRLLSIHL